MVTQTQKEATQVSVQLTDCGTEDVRTVFTKLSGVFECDRDPLEAHWASPDRPEVCSAEFDVSQHRGRLEPTPLEGAVAAEIQGTPWAVHQLREALTDAFAVREESAAAGDQEQQLWLRLENRAA